MNVRPIYIYLGLFVIVVLAIVLFTRDPEPVVSNNPHAGMGTGSGEMPNDDIHRGMNMGGNSAPGSGNVSSSFKERMEKLETTIAGNPDDTASKRIYAEMLASAHQSEKAIELLESILEKDSKRVDIMLTLSFIEYNRGGYEKAGEYTKNILQIEPLNPEAFYNYGAIEAAKGNKEKAKEIWSELIKKIPASEAAQLADESLKKL